MNYLIKIITALTLVFSSLAGNLGIFPPGYRAVMSFDFSEKTGKVMKGASGYLYGIAENGVPSAEMAESVDIKTIVQKVPGGLQHPVGDLNNADKILKCADYEIVYLQDVYDTWYYLDDDIMEKRSQGIYDWQKLLDEDYLPKVRSVVGEMAQKEYAAPVVYCLFNECDNGLWFGESQKDENPANAYGVWCDYNKIGRDNFNSAWKQTYDLVKSIDPSALTGGPGFCDFNADEIEYFLDFCLKNDCLPDVMIYHELAEYEAFYFDEHIREYRETEKKLGIDALEIIISEYGMMSENGYPGEMIKYITQFEDNKVYGDTAYWRLADNLNDTCADSNSPNAEWWLMRWYTDMRGETVKGKNLDLLSSNFANYFKYDYDELSFNGFTGIASISDDGREIDIVCGGGSGNSAVLLKNLRDTGLFHKKVRITVEEAVYKGLYGTVDKPVVRSSRTKFAGSTLKIPVDNTDAANAYHIVIRPADEAEEVICDAEPRRYEFENGKLSGGAYTYNSYCPASGGNENGDDLVGGLENAGDSVEITVNTDSGDYLFDFIYGNSNDGAFNENGRQNPDDRADTKALLTVDGEKREISLPNTIKSEYTSCFSLVLSGLDKGEHVIKAEHLEGTFVLDSLVVTPYEGNNSEAVLRDEDRTSETVKSFLVVAPADGYYELTTQGESLEIDGAKAKINNGSVTAYLKRGLNFVDVESEEQVTLNAVFTGDTGAGSLFTADMFTLEGGAANTGAYIDNINSSSGSASFTYVCPEAGEYRVTLDYSNNGEGGVHDYNVDLIERYVTVSVNGDNRGNRYCRNTYSWQTRKTVTFTLYLEEGENIISFSNDGSENFNGSETYAPRIYSAGVFPSYIEKGV
ncbi:MAG: hypothetical protein K6F64_05985 [Clostridia bacterium]|nr:hypothetical protein [Clostridia bacterium]